MEHISDQILYCLTSFFNPRGYRSRVRNYREFAGWLRQLGVPLLTVEIAFADREHEVTREKDPWALRLRTTAELWHKERALNLGLARLHQLAPEWRYCAWLDADIRLARPHWWLDAVELLHHYPVIQLFTQARQLLPDHTVQFACDSIGHNYQRYGALEWGPNPGMTGQARRGHPGLGWAFRRDVLDQVGGFLDVCANGSGDLHMAGCYTGQPMLAVPADVSPGYRRAILRYAGKCAIHVRKQVAALPGACDHYWHGRSKERGYEDRWRLLVQHQFDPYEDIGVDTQGLYRWSGNKPSLEIALKQSLAARNEDGTEA